LKGTVNICKYVTVVVLGHPGADPGFFQGGGGGKGKKTQICYYFGDEKAKNTKRNFPKEGLQPPFNPPT